MKILQWMEGSWYVPVWAYDFTGFVFCRVFGVHYGGCNARHEADKP
jgi:hypothetical protein